MYLRVSLLKLPDNKADTDSQTRSTFQSRSSMKGSPQKDDNWDVASLVTSPREQKRKSCKPGGAVRKDELSDSQRSEKRKSRKPGRPVTKDESHSSQKSRPGSPQPDWLGGSSRKSRPGSPQNQLAVPARRRGSHPESPTSVKSKPGSPRDHPGAVKTQPLSPEKYLLDRRTNFIDPNGSYDITPEVNERWDTKSIAESVSSSSKSVEYKDYADLGEPPHDRYRIVWIIVAMHGIGVLIPWNMFITIAPTYYVEYWFTIDGNKTTYAKSFMSALGITSQLPNFLMSVLNVMQIIGGSLMIRIVGTLAVNCINVAVIIAIVIFQDPSREAMAWFYYISLTIVVIMNASNGLYQNSVFGLTADFPAAYTNAIVVGNNICGTFISILSIATTIAFITDTKSVAIVYFSISLVVLILCGLSLFWLSQIEFFKYYVSKGKQSRAAEHATRPSLQQFYETFRGCWMQLLSVFLVFFVTLAVFPTILVGITPNRKGEPWNSFIPKEIYFGVTVFLNFNLLAAIGSTTANFVQVPGPNLLLLPVAARLLFIPYFMLCNYNADDRIMPVFFNNEWFLIIGNAVMAFTSGYFSSLAMMYAPRVVPSSLSKTAGMMAALYLVTGIFCGVAFVPAITYMVNNMG